MKDKEALKLALWHEAMAKEPNRNQAKREKHEATAKFIKEALAQPEQEPVATLDSLEQEIYENTRQFVSRDVMEWMLKRYYTTPPQRKPLTDAEFAYVWREETGRIMGTDKALLLRAKQITEAAHGIKE